MLNSRLIEKLEQIVGKNSVEVRLDGLFVSPKDADSVSEIVKLANENKFKILPSGSGSAFNFSKLTSDDLVILKSDKLNHISRVVPEDLYVILEPGLPLKDLNRHLEKYNLFYPLSDGMMRGTIGGAVAAGLKGKSGDKEIRTKDYVLALEVVDPQGQILKVGARTFKSVSGYDLPRLFVGSWGTLGFITEISLRLIPITKRKYFPNLIPDHFPKNQGGVRQDLKSSVSSSIKSALDPNSTFFDLNSVHRTFPASSAGS
jgi:glycolate oxidase